MKRSLVRLLLVLPCLALFGCGQSVKTYPVKGKVTFPDGKPVTSGQIEFRSEAEATRGLNARGEIDSEGNYSVQTFHDGKTYNGAVAGPHTIVVIPPAYTGQAQLGKEPPPPPFPVRYRDYSQSGLSVTVEEGKADYPIQLQRK